MERVFARGDRGSGIGQANTLRPNTEEGVEGGREGKEARGEGRRSRKERRRGGWRTKPIMDQTIVEPLEFASFWLKSYLPFASGALSPLELFLCLWLHTLSLQAFSDSWLQPLSLCQRFPNLPAWVPPVCLQPDVPSCLWICSLRRHPWVSP